MLERATKTLSDIARFPAAVVAKAGLRPPWANTATVRPKLLTVGYERHRESASLVAELRAAGVERLVDVRELPLSRRRGFSKSALARALADAGITYEHERALGNPKPYRDLYKSGDVVAGRRAYTAHIRNGSAWAVDWLGETLAEHRTCVLCVEHDHRVCHRDVIVDELRRRMPDLVVEHL
jgi:uncharacterized protein (DUF488 family)